MSKKNNKGNIYNSKYNRYEKNGNNKSKLEDLDSTKNLDISFIDGKVNQDKIRKLVEQKTEILDVSEINKANEELKALNDNLPTNLQNCSFWLLAILCFVLLLFISYHFITVDHKKEEIREKETVKEKIVIDNNYLFLGDSITEVYDLDKYYPDLPVVNSGVSGYTTKDILERLDEMVYQYNPSKVFLLIGTNDLDKKVSNEEIFDNIKKIIKNIKEKRPYAEIYLESIYPINNTDNPIIGDYMINGNRRNEDIIEINRNLVKFAKEENITYIDLYSKLLDDSGMLKLEYTKDGLHMSDKGYEVITGELMKYIEK